MMQETHPRLDKISDNTSLHTSILQAAGIAVNTMGDTTSLSPLPYISTAIDQFANLVEASQAINDTKGSFKKLCQDVAGLLASLCQSRVAHKGENEFWPTTELEHDIQQIADLIHETSIFAEKKTTKKRLSHPTAIIVDEGEVAKLREKIKDCLDQFKLKAHINIKSKLVEMISLNAIANVKARQEAFVVKRKEAIRKLAAHMAPGARHDSSARQEAPRCLPNTGEIVLEKVKKWLADPGTPRRILWVHSSSGFGKTTLAQSIAEHYYESGALGASFFWSNVAPNRPTTHTGFVASIAYQLCRLNSDILTARVVDAVDTDPCIFDKSMEVQVSRLVIDPLLCAFGPRSSTTYDYLQSLLLVIDGVDEIEGVDCRKEVLSAILAAVQPQSLPLRVLLFSRYESDIRALLDTRCNSLVEPYPLEPALNRLKQDIRTYITSEFHNIRQIHPRRHTIPPDWPNSSDVDILVERSAGVFIYASVAMRYIGSHSGDPIGLLNEIISLKPTSNAIFSSLDAIYHHLLQNVVSQKNKKKARGILHWMLADTAEGMDKTISISESLLGLEEASISIVLKELSSVINIPGSSDPHFPLQFFHTSFGEFLKDKTRLGKLANSFWFDLHQAHGTLARRWIQYYSKQVKDIESIDSLGRTLSAIVYHCQRSRKPGSNSFDDQFLLNALETLSLDVDLVDIGMMDPKHVWKWIDPAIKFLLLLKESDARSRLYRIHETSVNLSLYTYWRQLSVKSRENIPLILLACTHKDLTAADSLTRFVPIKDRNKEDVYKPTILCLNMLLLMSGANSSRNISLLYRLLTSEHWPPVVSTTQYSYLSLCLVKDLLYRRRLNSDLESGLIFFRSQLPAIIVKVLARASYDDDENAELVSLIKEKILLSTGDNWEELRQACEAYITKYEHIVSEFTSEAQLEALHSATSDLVSTQLPDVDGTVTATIATKPVEVVPVSTFEQGQKNTQLHTPPETISDHESALQTSTPNSMLYLESVSDYSIPSSATASTLALGNHEDLKSGAFVSPIVVVGQTLPGFSLPASSSTVDITPTSQLSTASGRNTVRAFGPFRFRQERKYSEVPAVISTPQMKTADATENSRLPSTSILGMDATRHALHITMSKTEAQMLPMSSNIRPVDASHHDAASSKAIDNTPKTKLAAKTLVSRDSTIGVALRSIKGSFSHLASRVTGSFRQKKQNT